MDKKATLKCIVYLSTGAELSSVKEKEGKQLKYIREYAKANHIEIIKIIHRGGLGQNEVNRQYDSIVSRIKNKFCDGILLANMASVSKDLFDAYNKVGKVIAAGGHILTVDEGNLKLPLKLHN